MQEHHVESAIYRVRHAETLVEDRQSRLRHDHAIDRFNGESGAGPGAAEGPKHQSFPELGRGFRQGAAATTWSMPPTPTGVLWQDRNVAVASRLRRIKFPHDLQRFHRRM